LVSVSQPYYGGLLLYLSIGVCDPRWPYFYTRPRTTARWRSGEAKRFTSGDDLLQVIQTATAWVGPNEKDRQLDDEIVDQISPRRSTTAAPRKHLPQSLLLESNLAFEW